MISRNFRFFRNFPFINLGASMGASTEFGSGRERNNRIRLEWVGRVSSGQSKSIWVGFASLHRFSLPMILDYGFDPIFWARYSFW